MYQCVFMLTFSYVLTFFFGLPGSWDSVFQVAVVLYIVGTVVWNVFSTGEKVLEWAVDALIRTKSIADFADVLLWYEKKSSRLDREI